MRFKALASGSNGNAIFVEGGSTRLLVDAGISCKRICDGLLQLQVTPGSLSGILITHEHSDHVCGLKILCKKYRVPVYGTPETINAIRLSDRNGEIPDELYHVIYPWEVFDMGDFTVLPLKTYHDAANSVAYRMSAEGKSVAVMTDSGTFDERIVENLQGLDGLLLESNHDIRMLETGSYPYALKRRILGDYGHLSNERSGELLCRLLHKNLKFILLGHLSEENNYPDIALLAVKNEIDLSDVPFTASDFRISIATREAPSELFEI